MGSVCDGEGVCDGEVVMVLGLVLGLALVLVLLVCDGDCCGGEGVVGRE